MLNRKIFYLLVLFLTVTTFFNCKTSHTTTLSPLVYLSVKSDITDTFPTIIFSDNFNSYSYLLDKKSFSESFPITDPGSYIQIKNSDVDTTFYIFQPDSVYITITSKNISIRNINTENRNRNLIFNTINPIRKNDSTYNRFYFSPQTYKWTPQKETSYDSALKVSFKQEKDIALKLIKELQISDKGKSEILKNIDIHYNIDPYMQGLFKEEVLDSFGKLNRDFVKYINGVNTLSKQEFLRNGEPWAISEIFSQLSSHTNKPPVKDVASLLGRYEIVKKYFQSNALSYQYLVASIQYDALSRKIPLSDKRLSDFNKELNNNVFKDNIEEAEKMFTSINKPAEKTFYDQNLHSFNLDEIVFPFKGKPLLIDFWASWCGPCVQAMPKTLALKEKHKDLDIALFSIDKDQYNWKSAIEKMNLQSVINFRRNYSNEDSIFNKIKEIPKYGLLQKDGSIKILDEVDEIIIGAYLKEYDVSKNIIRIK